MNCTEFVLETTNYKTKLLHLRKLLGFVKGSIRLAMKNNDDMKYHFRDIWNCLEANGVKDSFDSGREYDNYIKGVKND